MQKNFKLITLIIIFGISAFMSVTFYAEFLEDKSSNDIEVDLGTKLKEPTIEDEKAATSTININ